LRKRRRQQQLPSPSLMALLQKDVMTTTITFFSGFVTKKVTVVMSSPFSMVVVL